MPAYDYQTQVFIGQSSDLADAIAQTRRAMADWLDQHGDWRNLQHSIAQAQTAAGDWVFTLFVTVVRVREPVLVNRIGLTAANPQ
ncbi:MAG: hypothetical protein HC828_01850 [Blastochloris sp.]|nr:hypothetical protein [Blastochloris sp.]